MSSQLPLNSVVVPAVVMQSSMEECLKKTLRVENLEGSLDNESKMDLQQLSTGVFVCTIYPEAGKPRPLKLRWEVPATGVKGVWTSQALHKKRLKADWEEPDCSARASVEAPVVSVFGHDDENILTFASSDAVHTSSLAAPIREENNLLCCSVSLFTEEDAAENLPVKVRIDIHNCSFSESLQNTANWWQNDIGYTPMHVPQAAKMPVYSTWYAFHQNLDTDELLAECKIAKALGCDTIIVDDGWQTLDANRGYDYTGDWEPVRIQEMKAFTTKIHALGMKAMLWYSVPFVGVKSKAFHRFENMLLTKEHRWAPVFDPRYPEVRDYLVSKYVEAVGDWGFDGLKLDFIDDFRDYDSTPKGMSNGRDYASVNEAVEVLLRSIKLSLLALDDNVLIEFRQRYNGPVVRQNANMLRAFDCPADAVTNRIRTTDLRLLGSETAIHSDMLTWHSDSSVEVAALQLNSVLFSVPQISIKLQDAPQQVLKMIAFYLNFYRDNIDLLLNGPIKAVQPLENYPALEVSNSKKKIIGCYAERPVEVNNSVSVVMIINGSLRNHLLLKIPFDLTVGTAESWSVVGELVFKDSDLKLSAGYHTFDVPAGGILSLSFR